MGVGEAAWARWRGRGGVGVGVGVGVGIADHLRGAVPSMCSARSYDFIIDFIEKPWNVFNETRAM